MQATCIATYTDCNAARYFSDATTVATWSSNNTSVATFDGITVGLLLAHAAGAASITASYSDFRYILTDCSAIPATHGYSSAICVTNSGVPDHLEVFSDRIDYKLCSIGPVVRRLINYDIVDANGLSVSNVSVDEALSNVTSNTCQNGPPKPSTCALVGSSFTDGLTVDCNTVGGSCGFTIGIQQWHWCAASTLKVAIGTLSNDVIHNDATTILGHTVPPETNEITPGTTVFP
jgi:hypothetical protein